MPAKAGIKETPDSDCWIARSSRATTNEMMD
jgi:hypothetical protein